MDNITMFRDFKQKKLMEERNINGSGDRLSALPDTVLHHILSLLPTEDAVATSIASKRFENMWTSLANLYFINNSRARHKLFMNFVETVLTHRDPSNIHEFSLECLVQSDVPRIITWLSAAIRRKVKVLRICLDSIDKPLTLPHRLFNCDSLEELELNMSYDLKLPSSICFSSLKKLTLRRVIFQNDHLANQLFSGCPVLEELDIKCSWVNLKAVSISCPKLRRLTISEHGGEVGDCCQVMIFGRSLEFFSYEGSLWNEYFFAYSSPLRCARLFLVCDSGTARPVAYRLHKVLHGLSNVQKLQISSGTFEVYGGAKELFVHVPVFNSLTHLELDDGTVQLDLEGLHVLLQRSPNLESIEFANGAIFNKSPEQPQQNLSLERSRLSPYLQTIRIRCFSGSLSEIAAIKILLARAPLLERMIIHSCLKLTTDLELRHEVEDLLFALPRSSSACSIYLI